MTKSKNPKPAKTTKVAIKQKGVIHSTPPKPPRPTKQQRLIECLGRPDGATIAQLAKELAWQPHSVRGVISGVLKKKLGLKLTSTLDDGGDRHYRIV